MQSTNIEWNKLRFLVVEDDKDMRNIIVRLLDHLGATRVGQAKDGQEALPYLTERVYMPDCVIADIVMEPMSGIELSHIIRSDSRIVRHNVPLILVTGHTDATNVRLAKKLDVDGFVAKPVSRVTLTRRIEQALTRKKPINPRRHYAGITLPQKFMRRPDGFQAKRIYFGPEDDAFTPAYKAAQTAGQGARSKSGPIHPNVGMSLEKSPSARSSPPTSLPRRAPC